MMIVQQIVGGRPLFIGFEPSHPSATVQHMLGWVHPIALCEHPDCVSTLHGAPMPSLEDVAAWRQKNAGLMFVAGFFDAVNGHPLEAHRSTLYAEGHAEGLAWKAVHHR